MSMCFSKADCSANLSMASVDRFSPHVISAMFFGHTHEDELSVSRVLVDPCIDAF